MPDPLVLPRPGADFPKEDPIPAPTEEEFTSTFGTLLPRVQYLSTPLGKAAYYVFPAREEPGPESPAPPGTGTVTGTGSGDAASGAAPSRVLLIHGVQTPALGLFPLVTALRSRFAAATLALVDLWGHGLSETPVVPLATGVFAGLVDAVLGELGWKQEGVRQGTTTATTAVVGYSFGSVVGMEWLAGQASRGEKGVHSLTLVAPAGLLKKSWFTDEEQEWLGSGCRRQDEEKAADFVVRVLEGGPLTVPADWRQSVARGEVVAQAVKEWQLREHAGHRATVVGVFRDGSVFENQALFRRARGTGVPMLAVLGELDELSTVDEVRELGLETRVVMGAGHAVVREQAEEVAERIGEFWTSV